jgi:hypothetical protein
MPLEISTSSEMVPRAIPFTMRSISRSALASRAWSSLACARARASISLTTAGSSGGTAPIEPGEKHPHDFTMKLFYLVRVSPGQYFSWSWTRGGEPSGNINVRTDLDAVVLMYRSRSYGDAEWKSIEQRVPIAWTACHWRGD